MDAREQLIFQLRIWVPVGTLALMLLLAAWQFRPKATRRPRASSFAWACAAGVAPVAFALVWVLRGLYVGRFLGLVLLCAIALVAFALCLFRERIEALALGPARKRGTERRAVIGRDVVILLVASVLGMLALEFSWSICFDYWDLNETAPFSGLNNAQVGLFCAVLEYVLILLTMTGLYFLNRRHGVAPAVLVVALLLIGIAQYFLILFKYTIIQPRDLFALGTAASVASAYTYAMLEGGFYAISCAVGGVALLSFVHPPFAQASERAERVEGRGKHFSAPAGSPTSQGKGLLFDLGMAVLSFAVVAALVVVPSYRDTFGLNFFYYSSTAIKFSKGQGLIPTFIYLVQDLPIKKPQGYTDEAAEALIADYAARYDAELSEEAKSAQAAYAEQPPSIVVIMNEAFADLSIFEQLHAGYEGPTFFSRDSNPLQQGALAVSVLGGGTCNSEFEFLTGANMAAIGEGKYPYSMYQLGEMPSVARQLKELGYTTTAIHPNYNTNWNRDRAYPALGFDTFIDRDSFENAEIFRWTVRDKESFAKVLEVLQGADPSEPQFIFEVTMQNHSGYDTGLVPADKLVDYHPSDFDDSEMNQQLNEYLSCIKQTDEDFQWFLGEVGKLNRRVIVVMFGDHHPSLSRFYNDAVFGEDASQWRDGETEAQHIERIQSTVYGMWSNYDIPVAGEWVDNTSASFFAAKTLQLAGVPLTVLQKAQLAAHEELLAYNVFGYEGADGTWYGVDDTDSPVANVRRDLSYFDYLSLASVR